MPRFVTQTGTFFLAVLLLLAPAMGAAQSSVPSPWPMTADVRLTVPGNSRFATEVAGHEAVVRQLAALGLEPHHTVECRGPFTVRNGESAWLTTARLDGQVAPVRSLVLVQTDSAGAAYAITVLFHDEPRIARMYPRDDGIVRVSLAEQRNRRAVQRLHGERAVIPMLAANGTRVFVTVPASDGDTDAWRLIAYTFDPTGTVRSLSASAALPTSARFSNR